MDFNIRDKTLSKLVLIKHLSLQLLQFEKFD